METTAQKPLTPSEAAKLLRKMGRENLGAVYVRGIGWVWREEVRQIAWAR